MLARFTFYSPTLSVFILLLALFHGLQYASLLPPWGLIDEAQHLDYIRQVGAEQEIPLVGDTLLDPQVVESLFSTRHWQNFHWSTPPTDAPDDLGLVAHSYEGYQPPLYYLLLSFPASLISQNVHSQLFALRYLSVLISLLPFIGLIWLARQAGQTGYLPIGWSMLILLVWPERTAAVSRLNNDVLAESLAALSFIGIIAGLDKKLTRTGAGLLGILLAAGIATKLSLALMLAPTALFYFWKRAEPGWFRSLLLSFIPPTVVGAVLMARNLLLYGDLTGYAGFHALFPISSPTLSLSTIAGQSLSLFRHTWMIWWKGAEVGSNPLVEVGFFILGVICILAIVGSLRVLRDKKRGTLLYRLTILSLFTVSIYSLFLLWSTFAGIVPLPQGRLLLPAGIAVILILTTGLQSFKRGGLLLAVMLAGLFLLDQAALFGNLLPYHYYWSHFVPTALEPQTVGSFESGIGLFWSSLQQDKPGWLVPLLPLFTLLYPIGILSFGLILTRVIQPAAPVSVFIDGRGERDAVA